LSKRQPETFISIDVETDGPCPGMNSMLSLGAAAFTLEQGERPLDLFTVNLRRLLMAEPDPDTMEWWKKQPQSAWLAATGDAIDPQVAMAKFTAWVRRFESPVAVCYPAGFDFTFVYWYLCRFIRGGNKVLGFSCIDMKSFAMAQLRRTHFKSTTKASFKKSWTAKEKPHSHVAVEDAVEQGVMFMRMLKDAAERG
jgi:hypothetical protein